MNIFFCLKRIFCVVFWGTFGRWGILFQFLKSGLDCLYLGFVPSFWIMWYAPVDEASEDMSGEWRAIYFHFVYWIQPEFEANSQRNHAAIHMECRVYCWRNRKAGELLLCASIELFRLIRKGEETLMALVSITLITVCLWKGMVRLAGLIWSGDSLISILFS